jgi:hypothetical protein
MRPPLLHSGVPDSEPVPASPPSTPPPPLPPSTSTAPGEPAPPLTSRLGGKPGLTIILAVAIALLLVLALLALGTPASSSGGGSSTGVAFSSARTTGSSVTSSSGGNWELLDAFGLDLPNAATEPLGLSNLSANCTVTSLSGPLPSSLTIPRFTGNLSSGDAAEWDLAFLQPATLSEIAVAVTGGTVALALEISGAHCLPTNTSAEPSISATVVDSTVAASAVAAAGATAFLAAHPKGVSLVMFLIPFTVGGSAQPSSGYPAWLFDYSTCPVLVGITNGTEPPGETFDATVNATTGAVVPGSATTGTCGSSSTLPLGTNFAWGTPVNATGTTIENACTMSSGHYCYSIEIAGAGGGITTSNLALSLRNSAGATIAWPTGVSIYLLTPTTAVYQSSYSTTSESWTSVPGFSGALASGDNIVIYTAATGASQGLLGDSLVAIGVNGYSGTVSSNAFS